MAASVNDHPTIQSAKSISRSACLGLAVFVVTIESFVPCLYSMISGLGGWWDGILIPTWFLFHFACIAFVGGFAGRSWLAGLFCGVLALTLFFSLFIIGAYLGNQGSSFYIMGIRIPEEPMNAMCIAFLFPWIVLVSFLPFYLVRFCFGWRLTLGSNATRREPLVLGDFFLLMMSVACALWMTTAPRLIFENGSENFSIVELSGLGLVWGALNLIVVLPSIYFVFHVKSYWKAVLLSIFAGMIGPSVLAFIASLYSSSSIVYTVLPSLLLCVMLSGITVLLRRLGLAIQSYEPKVASTKRSNPLDETTNPVEEEFESIRPFLRSPHFRWTALLATIALIASFSLTAVTSHRKQLDKNLEALRVSLGEKGVLISLRNREIVSLVFDANAERQLLSRLASNDAVEKISLSDGSLPSDFVEALSRYPKLKSLNLGLTGLTESQLRELVSAPFFRRLSHLSIAGNPLSATSIYNMLGSGPTSVSNNLKSLDLSNLGLKDDDLSVLLQRYASLNLARNQITDRGLSDFLSLGGVYYHELDVSGNPIDGTAFNRKLQANELILDDCPLTDRTFSPSLVLFQGQTKLILKNTNLTDSFLGNLNGSALLRIELGDGNFSDAGVAKFLPIVIGLQELSLTGKQFTGDCFRDWSPSLHNLSMKGSGLVDENVTLLPSLFGTLDLSNTALTDAGLSKVKPSVFSIDLSNTVVTAKGILNSPLPPRCQIRLAQGQFSLSEFALLRNKFQVLLDDVPDPY